MLLLNMNPILFFLSKLSAFTIRRHKERPINNFSRDASTGDITASRINSQTKTGMAATASEGTARKLVNVNDRTKRYIEFKGDNRKDGRRAGVNSGAAQFKAHALTAKLNSEFKKRWNLVAKGL